VDRFTMEARQSGTQAVIVVAGDLDAATAPAFRERLRSVIAGGATRLVLDLRRVTFVDPGQTSIRKVFRVTGLDEVFPVHTTPEAAEDDCVDPPAA